MHFDLSSDSSDSLLSCLLSSPLRHHVSTVHSAAPHSPLTVSDLLPLHSLPCLTALQMHHLLVSPADLLSPCPLPPLLRRMEISTAEMRRAEQKDADAISQGSIDQWLLQSDTSLSVLSDLSLRVLSHADLRPLLSLPQLRRLTLHSQRWWGVSLLSSRLRHPPEYESPLDQVMFPEEPSRLPLTQ